MGYTKTIVCLANSRKTSGRCIAGREITTGKIGPWIRPVSARDTREISEADRRYEDGTRATVYDVIEIEMLQHVGENYQPENHLIDDGYYWRKVGRWGWQTVAPLVESVRGPLWLNGYSTYHGANDKIPEYLVIQQRSSLMLVQPDDLTINVGRDDGMYGPTKRRVRAIFRLSGSAYNLSVTDPDIEGTYLRGADGTFSIQAAILCISLGEVWNGFAFKLVATIFTPDRQ